MASNSKERQADAARRAIADGVGSQKELMTWWQANAKSESLGGIIRAWRVLRPGGSAPMPRGPRATTKPSAVKVKAPVPAESDDLDDVLGNAALPSRRMPATKQRRPAPDGLKRYKDDMLIPPPIEGPDGRMIDHYVDPHTGEIKQFANTRIRNEPLRKKAKRSSDLDFLD